MRKREFTISGANDFLWALKELPSDQQEIILQNLLTNTIVLVPEIVEKITMFISPDKYIGLKVRVKEGFYSVDCFMFENIVLWRYDKNDVIKSREYIFSRLLKSNDIPILIIKEYIDRFSRFGISKFDFDYSMINETIKREEMDIVYHSRKRNELIEDRSKIEEMIK